MIPHHTSPSILLSTSEQYRSRHALVIGGSMAGLLAARALVDHFEQVTILDRDVFPETPDYRKGVPQSHHAHALLPKGHMIISRMFPGIMDDLRAAGALSVSGSVPFIVVSAAGKLPARRLDGEFMSFSRYLLEWYVRHHLSKYIEIHLRANTEVTGLLTNHDRTRVIGVQTRERGIAGQTDTIMADLVVDASGRHSQTPQWLTTLGYDAPPEETVHAQIGYTSRFYAKPTDFPNEWQCLTIKDRPPHNPRGGLLTTVDNGRWHVSLFGIGGHYPPLDEEGFLQWARELSDPCIYESLRVAVPLTPLYGYRTPKNFIRRFDRLKRWPLGFIVTGDAVCAFNPIYGQGMTICAMDAEALAESLREQQQRPRPDFERCFQQRVARIVAVPWMMAAGEDLVWQEVTLSGKRLPLSYGLVHRYMDLILHCAVEDSVVAQARGAVLNLLAPPQSLLKSSIIIRVLRNAFERMIRGDAGPPPSAWKLALSPEALAFLRSNSAKTQKPNNLI